MQLWVTRPIENAQVLRAQLIAQGYDVTLEPLLRVEFFPDEPIELGDAQALIVTSGTALRALAGRPEEQACKALPLFAVGRGTAQAASAMGFRTVIEGPSTGAALSALIVNMCSINDGSLIHLSGENVAYDLCGELRQLGYHVFQPILYRTEKVQTLSDHLLGRLKRGEVEAVMLLSGRTAEAYVEIIESYDLLSEARSIACFCLSKSVAGRLEPLQPFEVKTSSRPNIDDMLALTATYAAN